MSVVCSQIYFREFSVSFDRIELLINNFWRKNLGKKDKIKIKISRKESLLRGDILFN